MFFPSVIGLYIMSIIQLVETKIHPDPWDIPVGNPKGFTITA